MRALNLTGQTINGVIVLEKLPKRGHMAYYRTMRRCGHEAEEMGSNVGKRPNCFQCAHRGKVPANKIPDTLTAADIADYEKGRTSSVRLGEKYGCDTTVILRWLHKRGVAMTHHRPDLRLRVIAALKAGVSRGERRNGIARRFAAGETAQQIADDLGISKERVCQLLRSLLNDSA